MKNQLSSQYRFRYKAIRFLGIIADTFRASPLYNESAYSEKDIARFINPILRGWWQYYGRFYPTAMFELFKYLDERLAYYLRRKYRNLWGHKGRSLRKLNQIARQHPGWLVHWHKFGRAMVG